ncbi:MAG: Ig-like domain-containing protein [Ruminococcus flavefaciens]|nr:Ig-like domain-containing protein [Ruminococcus flavefaciens]
MPWHLPRFHRGGVVTVSAEEVQEARTSQKTVVTAANVKNYLVYQPDQELVWRNGDDLSWDIGEAFKEKGENGLFENEVEFSFAKVENGTESSVNEVCYAGTYKVYVKIEGESFTTNNQSVFADTITIGCGERKDKYWKDPRGNSTSEDDFNFSIDLNDALEQSPGTNGNNIQGTAQLTGDGASLFSNSSPSVSIETDEDGRKIAELSLSPKEEIENLDGEKELTLTVDFGSSFVDFEYEVEIPIVITKKAVVELKIADNAEEPWKSGEGIEFTYNREKITLPDIACVNPDTEIATGSLTHTVTRDDEIVSDDEIKNAGFYRAEYIYSTEDNYGVLTIDFFVDRAEITTDNWDNYFTYSPDLTWNGEGRWDECEEALQVKNGVTDLEKDGYWLRIDGDLSDAGIYETFLGGGSENYYIEDVVKISDTEIKKAAYSATDLIEGIGFFPEWGDDYWEVRAFYRLKEDVAPGWIWDELQFTTSKNGEKNDHPENAGVYDLYLALDSTDNYTGFASSDSGLDFEITQRKNFEGTYNVVFSKEEIEDLTSGTLPVFEEEQFAWVKEMMIDGDNLTPTISYDGNSAVKNAALNEDTGELNIEFADDAASATGNLSTTITICFNFNNIEITRKVVVTVTDKAVVDIERVGEYYKVYDGEAIIPMYRVHIDDETLVDDKAEADGLTVTVNAVDGQERELQDAGSYEMSVKYETDNYYGEASFIYVIDRKPVVIKGVDKTCTVGSDEIKAFLRENIGEQQIDAAGKGKGCSITEGEYYGNDERPTIVSWLDDSEDSWVYDSGANLDALNLPVGTYQIKFDFNEYGSQNYDIDLQNGTLNIVNATPGGSGTPEGPGGSSVTPVSPGGTVTPGIETPQPEVSVVENPDGSKTETKTEEKTNAAGKEVVVTTTTKTDADGKVTAVTEKTVIENPAKNTTASVTVKKDGSGNITSAKASVVKAGTEKESGTKGTVSASVVKQITEAAGTTDVVITQKVTKEDGSTAFKVQVNASDLVSGESLYIVKLNTKTGEKTLVNAKEYKVSDAGNVSVTMDKNGTYVLLNDEEAEEVSNEILKTVKAEKSSKTVKAGKKTEAVLSDKLNMDNVKKVTYTSSKKSVVTVNKNGKVTAKKPGTATVKVKVTLKNGKSKTVKIKIKVK